MKNTIKTLLVAALAGCALAATTIAWRQNRQIQTLQSRIAAIDAERPKPAAADGRKPVDTLSPDDAPQIENQDKTPITAEMKVVSVGYNDQDELDIRLSERPDMSSVRQYVFAGPISKGVAAFRYSAVYNPSTEEYDPHLFVTADFVHGTNLTLRILSGFPVYGKTSSSNLVVRPLADDYVHEFRRKDAPPEVRFASHGRYLPPAGRRALEIESINASKIFAEIRRIPAVNIVQILALEAGRYSKIHKSSWPVDGEWIEDVSGRPATKTIKTENRLNERETSVLEVSMDDERPAKGVFLVTVRNADIERHDRNYWWDDDKKTLNPNRYRLVCMTDIGLSVRRSEGSLVVWTTSLTSGNVVSGTKIEVFSSAGVKIADGTSGSDGLCTLSVPEGETPFAVIASLPDGSDRTFLSLDGTMLVDETAIASGRENYLVRGKTAAFVWTERGIYRHGENIFFHAILRDGEGRAPKPFPVELELFNPGGDIVAKRFLIPSPDGAVECDNISVAQEQPSGSWELVLSTPGEDGFVLGRRSVSIEEFAPPQIRVKVEAAKDTRPEDFSFEVSAEHLYGGPAASLKAEGAIVFEDAPFSPDGWKGYRFGDEGRSLKPNYRKISACRLDESGRASFMAPIWADCGLPRAAVKAIAEGMVFEDGGRPATARTTAFMHRYPFYIGSPSGGMLKLPSSGHPSISIACVGTDGVRLAEPRRLTVKLEKIESVYSYKRRDDGSTTWDCERVRSTMMEGMQVESSVDSDTQISIPVKECGDYAITVCDSESDVSFGTTFYIGDNDDSEVRASLSNPVKVSLTADKPFYRVGEKPRILVKSPFAGTALLSVLRDGVEYSEVLTLTNATSEVTLRETVDKWAPNVDVAISVVQSVAGQRHLAARAHGETTIRVRPAEREIAVSVKPSCDASARKVTADITAAGARFLAVTLVDEGINLLTGEPTPDPIARFAKPRTADRPLFDLYHRILPVIGDDVLKANGAKTGGGAGAELLGRVSPVPTRRFRPLALWQANVPVSDGRAHVEFDIPEFVGEVRVTAVAWSDIASGAASAQQKVAPKLVSEPDAPRFVAPGDEFELTLPLANTSGGDGDFEASIVMDGATVCERRGRIAAGETIVIRCRAKAPENPGEAKVVYCAAGFGERHESTIYLPVRPAVPWQETAGVARLSPGEKWKLPEGTRRWTVSGSRLGELKTALDWLADYPHGCLEQTSSRIFPLVSAGGILNALAADGSDKDMSKYVESGVARVESMIRERDFVMWPDCTYAPWDTEVSLYAAHFLIEAERAGAKLKPEARGKVMRFLAKWAMSPTNSISAYACHTLALAGKPEKDRMLKLYDGRDKLDLLSRARLARAFVAIADRRRAAELVANAESPSCVKEAAFLALALLDLDPDDERLVQLLQYMLDRRDKALYSWGTTSENAHALLAAGAYYRHHPPRAGEPSVSDKGGYVVNEGAGDAYVSWKSLTLPSVESFTNETCGISISRRFLDADGNEVDLSSLERGQMLVVELTLGSSVSRDYSDIVIEDLFAGAFEPVRTTLDPSLYHWLGGWSAHGRDWVMRSDARDDRMLVFSKKFHMEADENVRFYYPLRVVTAGSFALPGAAAEAMYQPALRGRAGAGRVVVRD